MSILFFEGFDLYGTDVTDATMQQDMLSRRDVWNGYYESVNGASLLPRNDGNALRLDTNVTGNLSSYTFLFVNSSLAFGLRDEIIVGMAFMKESPGSTVDYAPRLFSVFGADESNIAADDQAYYCIASINATEDSPGDCTIDVALGNHGVNANITIPAVAAGIWHYIEVRIRVKDTTRLAVKLNGALMGDIAGPPAWGGVNGGIRTLYLHPAKSNYHPGGIWYDDMVMLDPTDDSDGVFFQDFLGPIQIRPCPLNADSTPSSWVASSGGAKYQDVDEQPGPNDLDATYISTVSAPQTQVFRCSPYDADLPIIAVTAFASVKQPDPTNGVAQLAFMVDSQEDASPLPLQNYYRLFSQNYVTLPGGSITVPVIQATDWGVRSLPSS